MTGTVDMERVRFIANDPNSSPEARRHARMLLARESGDPYVDMNLDAAATPITPDQPFDWEQPLAEFDARNAARVRERQDARVQQQLAMEQEYNDMRAGRGAPMAGSLGETQMVDGVEVPVIDGGGGRKMYRLGDVKAAQAAQREAARLAGVREVNRLDREQFGYGADDAVTPEQLAARQARQAAFAERASSPEVVTRRVQALAQRMGVSEKQARDAYNKAAAEMPNVAEALDAARTELSGMEGVADSRLQQKADARKMITRRAQAQNNPMEYLGRDDLNDWQRMVMARRLVGSSGFTPIEMQARQNEGLQRLGERFMQNPAMLMGGQQMEAMDRRAKAEKVAGWRRIAADHASGLYNSLGWRGRDTAMRALQAEGASPEEALEIVEEFFAPEDAPPEAEPARGAGGLPLPAGTPPYQWR